MNNIEDKILSLIKQITDATYNGNGEFLKFDGTYDSLRGLINYRLKKINAETNTKREIGILQMPSFSSVWFLYDRQTVYKAACEDSCQNYQKAPAMSR